MYKRGCMLVFFSPAIPVALKRPMYVQKRQYASLGLCIYKRGCMLVFFPPAIPVALKRPMYVQNRPLYASLDQQFTQRLD